MNNKQVNTIDNEFVEVEDTLLEAIELSILFDFYGDLLNDKTKDVFIEYVFNDLSLSEIAENKGITRQGVHDIIKRTIKKLREYEESLHLVSRFKTIEEKINNIKELIIEVEEIKDTNRKDATAKEDLLPDSDSRSKDILNKINDLADGVLENL